MIIDFGDCETPSIYKTRLCIVGSGPVGLSLAAEFLNAAETDVIIIESGSLKSLPIYEALNHVTNTGDTQSGLKGSRARVFGGTSTLWGGQAIPLSPLDFATRSWVANSGWPIKTTDLLEYFERAGTILRLDGVDFDIDIWKKDSGFKDNIDQKNLHLTFSRWSPTPNFSKKYFKDIKKSRHIKTLLNASVTEVETNENGTAVTSVIVKSPSGHTGRVHADIFVLCCGGIENARLLLCSTKRSPNGVGNQHRNVGAYFQDHVGFYGARLIPKDHKKFVNLFSSYFRKDQMYLPKLQLSERRQKETKSLNVTGNIGVEYTRESSVALKRLFNDLKSGSVDTDTFKNFAHAALDPIESLKLLFFYGVARRMYYPRRASYFLIANCETEPEKQSRIYLGSERDLLGMRKANVNWIVNDAVRRSLRIYFESTQAELDRLGIADSIIKPGLYEQDSDWKMNVFSLYHHIGTTRMSANEKSGVVDSECKVHGVENLYLGGSSVFPVSGSANPTLTAIALAIRLADHVKQSLRSENNGVGISSH